MSRKKIALYSILRKSYFNFFFEVGIAQIASYLRDCGHIVEMFFYHDDETVEEMAEVANTKFDYYAFSVYENNAEIIYQVSEKIKNIHPQSYIICGGQFATIYYSEILNACKAIDYIILGDGEIPFQYLLKGNSIRNYPYVVSQLGSQKDVAEFVNDSVEWKAAEDYYHIRQGEGYVHVLLSKNNVCTGHCTFCCRRMSSKIIYKSVDYIVEEITQVHKIYNITSFYFAYDDLFDPNDCIARKRIMELCDRLIELDLGITLHFYTKVTTFNDTIEDHKLLDKLYSAGFVNVYLGLESGNNDDLKLYNKRHFVDDNYMAVELFTQHHMNITMGFINIHPWTTLEKLKANYLFLRKIKPLDINIYVGKFLNIYKNSPLYRLLERDGLIDERYNYLNTTKYQYKDTRIFPIVESINEYFFCKDKMSFFTDVYSWHRFMLYYKGLLRFNNNLISFENEINLLKEDYLKILDDFFSIIYFENDIEKAKREYENFCTKFKKNNHNKDILVMKLAKTSLKK